MLQLGDSKGIVSLLILVVLVVASGPVIGQAQQLITAIQVGGNEYISQDVILADVAEILKIGEPFTAAKAEAAREAVLREGYFEDVVVSTRAVEGGIEVIISVVEKSRIDKILFVGNTVLTDEELREAIVSKVGHVIDTRIIRVDVTRIEETYRKHGYVGRVVDAGPDEFGVLTFIINEAHVERIDIKGRKRTKEWVIRRQIHTKPGALYREQDISGDIRRVFGLNIFQNVTPDIREGEEDPLSGVIVELTVEEKPTGLASFALAYSNLDDLVVMLSLSDSNLRGRAERGSVDLELFGRTSFNVRFYEPFLDRHDTSMDVALFDMERRRRFVGGAAISMPEDEYDERRTGSTVKFSRPTSETDRWSIGFRNEKVSSSFYEGTQVLTPGPGAGGASVAQGGSNTHSLPPDNPDLDPDKPDPGDGPGPIIIAAPLHPGGRISSATLGWTRDARISDKRNNPRSGFLVGTSWEGAGSILGGDTDFNQLTAEWRHYRPMGKRDVLAMRLMGGISFGNLPLFESFVAGGANTLRGYDEERFRGEKLLLLNIEYRRNISDKFGAVAFVDIGDAFGGRYATIVPGFEIPAEDQEFEPHVGGGIGLRAETPLGPIRLDFGFSSEGSQVHFGFGQIF